MRHEVPFKAYRSCMFYSIYGINDIYGIYNIDGICVCEPCDLIHGVSEL